MTPNAIGISTAQSAARERRPPGHAQAIQQHGAQHQTERSLVEEEAGDKERQGRDVQEGAPSPGGGEGAQGQHEAGRGQGHGQRHLDDGRPEPERARRRKDQQQRRDDTGIEAAEAQLPEQ